MMSKAELLELINDSHRCLYSISSIRINLLIKEKVCFKFYDVVSRDIQQRNFQHLFLNVPMLPPE